MPAHALFNNTVAAGTDGSAIAVTTWTTAPINTTVLDTATAFTLAANVLTVNASGVGNWIVRALVNLNGFSVNPTQGTRGRLRRTNNTPATLVLSSSFYQHVYSSTLCIMIGTVTLALGDTLELQGWIENGPGTFGKFGSLINSGESEVYAIIEFEQR